MRKQLLYLCFQSIRFSYRDTLEGDPKQPPKGVKYVIVNGKIAVENGKLTGVRAGKALLRSSHTKYKQ